jgi:CBS domain containing-hemolysin-like protein
VTALALLAAALLVAGNGYFVAAEFALISARQDRLQARPGQSSRAVRRVQRTLDATRHLSLLIAAAQLGVTVCSLALGAIAEPSVARLLEGFFDALNLPERWLHPVAFALALFIVVAAHMVLGEMVPKNVTIAGPERTALYLCPALARFARLTRPILVAVNWLSDVTLRRARIEPKDEVASVYEPGEIAGLLAESRREGLLAPAEHARLTGALALDEDTAHSVMVPVERLVTVPWQVTAAELERSVLETGFSRFPVRAADDPAEGAGGAPRLVGFVHAKDVLEVSPGSRQVPLPPRRLRRMVDVRPDARLSEVLGKLRRAGTHLGRVVTADGTTLGVATLDDVLARFVGRTAETTGETGGGSR